MIPSWYEERPEPEKTYRGLLVAATPVTSPGGRTRLLYVLHLEDQDGRLPVYAPDLEDQLQNLAGSRVAVIGRVVDLTDEGYGAELWLRAIA